MPKANQSQIQTLPTGTRSSNSSVMKALAPEDMAVLSQIQSLLSEITSGQGGAGAPAVAGAAGGPGSVAMAEGDEAVGGAKIIGPTFTPGSPEPSRVEGEEQNHAEPDGDERKERMQTAPANATTSVS